MHCSSICACQLTDQYLFKQDTQNFQDIYIRPRRIEYFGTTTITRVTTSWGPVW